MAFSLPNKSIKDNAVLQDLAALERHLVGLQQALELAGGCVIRFDQTNERLVAEYNGVTITLAQW